MSDATYAIFRSVDDLYQQLDDTEKVCIDQQKFMRLNYNILKWFFKTRKFLFVNLKVPIGIPVLNSAAYILDDKLQPVETPGTVGQLFISSPNLATGYCGGNSEARGFISTDVSGK